MGKTTKVFQKFLYIVKTARNKIQKRLKFLRNWVQNSD